MERLNGFTAFVGLRMDMPEMTKSAYQCGNILEKPPKNSQMD